MMNFENKISNFLRIEDKNCWTVDFDEEERVESNEQQVNDDKKNKKIEKDEEDEYDSDEDEDHKSSIRCFYLICRSKNEQFSSVEELNIHKETFHKPILKLNEPQKPDKKTIKEILSRLAESEQQTLSNRFNYAISLQSRENVLYLGMSFREFRPFETLIDVVVLKEMNKLETFKYKEIASYFDNDDNLIYISKFNKNFNKSRSFATETAGLQGANSDDGYFANLVNICACSINLNKHFNEEEIGMLKDHTKYEFYDCKDVQTLTVGELKIQANEILDLIRTLENSNHFSEKEIIKNLNYFRFHYISMLSIENKIICLQLIKESKTGVTLLPELKLEIIKRLSTYKKQKENNSIWTLTCIYMRCSEARIDQVLEDYKAKLNNPEAFESLISETKRLYKEKLKENIDEIYSRLFRRLISNVSSEINFYGLMDRQFVLNVFDYVFETNHRSVRKILEKERIAPTIKNKSFEALEQYANSLFNCLKIDKNERLNILRKITSAFEIHLQPYIEEYSQNIYLLVLYKTNKFDPLIPSISQDDLRDCIRDFAPNLDYGYLNQFFETNSRPGYTHVSDIFDIRIDSITKFMNFDLNEIKEKCTTKIKAKYVERYGSLPEPSKIHLNLRNDSNYKKRAKLVMWYNEHYEEKEDNRIIKYNMHDEYIKAIESGEPFNITDFSNGLQKSFYYLRTINITFYIDDEKKKRKTLAGFVNVGRIL